MGPRSGRIPSRPAAAGLLLAAALSLALAGCVTTLGSRAVAPSHFHYNEAIARSWNEQLLLNLVRLRYRDTPVFLEVGNVLTQYTFGGSASLSASASEGGSAQGGLGAGVAYSEQPTVTYLPLQGEAFVRRLLSPLPPSTLVLLSQSGWSIERLLLCCVQEVSGIPNAPSAAGPTPEVGPDSGPFRDLATRLRRLQAAGLLQVGIQGEGESAVPVLSLRPAPGGALAAEAEAVRALLGLPGGSGPVAITSAGAAAPDGPSIVLRGRSLLGVLFALSQGVKAPVLHEEAGLVTTTRDASGERFEWDVALGGLLRIRAADAPPTGAFVQVPYRGHWFFIEDSDLQSKTTFSLLTYLFSLQSAGGGGGGPLLTLSTGR